MEDINKSNIFAQQGKLSTMFLNIDGWLTVTDPHTRLAETRGSFKNFKLNIGIAIGSVHQIRNQWERDSDYLGKSIIMGI